MSTILFNRLWDPRYALICAILCFAAMETACGPVGRNEKERSSQNSEARMEPLMVSLDSATDNSYDQLSSKNTHGVVKNPNAILEIELQNLNAKQFQASKDLKANELMIENYRNQMFILGQRTVQKHSEADRSRAVVAELDTLIHRIKSLMTLNALRENINGEDNLKDEFNGSTDSASEHILAEPGGVYTLAAEHIDPPVEKPPVIPKIWRQMIVLAFGSFLILWSLDLLPGISDQCLSLEDTIANLVCWGRGHYIFLFRWFGRDIHPKYFVLGVAIGFVIFVVGYCNATVSTDHHVPKAIPISIPEPTPDGTSTSRYFYMLLPVMCLSFLILYDFLSDWYKCSQRSQPSATSQGVRAEKPDKIIMEINEHIARLGNRIVAIDERMARWEKKMTKLEKQHEDESEKRKAAELKMAAFDQTLDQAVTSILASVDPASAKTRTRIHPPVQSPFSDPTFRHPLFRQKPTATYPDPVKPESDSESMSEAETVAGAVTAGGVEIPSDSESHWILVTRKKKRDPK
jgi:hypothetical protein